MCIRDSTERTSRLVHAFLTAGNDVLDAIAVEIAERKRGDGSVGAGDIGMPRAKGAVAPSEQHPHAIAAGSQNVQATVAVEVGDREGGHTSRARAVAEAIGAPHRE